MPVAMFRRPNFPGGGEPGAPPSPSLEEEIGELSILRLSQSIECRAYLLIGRTLAVVRFNLRPGDLSLLIYDVNGRMRNSKDLLPFVSRIAQTVGIDGFVTRIGKKREVNSPFAICGNLGGKVFADIRRINADGVKLCFLVLLQERS